MALGSVIVEAQMFVLDLSTYLFPWSTVVFSFQCVWPSLAAHPASPAPWWFWSPFLPSPSECATMVFHHIISSADQESKTFYKPSKSQVGVSATSPQENRSGLKMLCLHRVNYVKAQKTLKWKMKQTIILLLRRSSQFGWMKMMKMRKCKSPFPLRIPLDNLKLTCRFLQVTVLESIWRIEEHLEV